MSISPEQKKRPTPIMVPPLPLSRPVHGPNAFAIAAQTKSESTENRSPSRDRSSMAKDAAPTATNSRLETSDPAPLSRSSSQRSRNRVSALTTLSNLMDQARGSPRKSDYASSASASSWRGSTTRSRHSERSYHAAMTAQAHLETLGEDDQTSRSYIEARKERKLFKMMGQVPPTPIDGRPEISDSYIMTTDLRSQYKSQEQEKEPEKSPKKKLFGMSLPTFNRSSGTAPAPPMPSKAAQVFGTDPNRKPRRIEARPIKPSGYARSMVKTPRSDTAKSLPPKLYFPHSHSRRHVIGSARRNRVASRKTPVGAVQCSHIKAIDALAESSRQSFSPPTPPEKDTPPESKPKLLHTQQRHQRSKSEDAHNSQEGWASETEMRGVFPSLANVPILEPVVPTYGSDSPTKFQPFTADEYVKMIERDCIHSVYAQLEQLESTEIQQDDSRSATSRSEDRKLQDRTNALRWSEENHYRNLTSDLINNRLSPEGNLLPRFYSPSDHSIQEFPEGGRPSQNTDSDRLLFTGKAESKDQYIGQTPSQGSASIEMVFQGEADEIDPRSVIGQMMHPTNQETTSPHKSEDPGTTTLEPQSAEKKDLAMRGGVKTGYLQPGHSVSGIVDMLNAFSPNTFSPYKSGIDREFTPNCPSAVPSPLHRAPKQLTPQSAITRGSQIAPRTPKTMEDHFFMTNEHVDVAGKILHDFVARCHQQEVSTITSKHEHLATKVEQHVEDIKSQLNFVNEKADHTSNQNHNINVKLDKLLGFIKTEVVEPLTTQSKRMADIEAHMKELQNTMKDLQLSMEQKLAETKISQHLTTGAYPTPVSALPSYPLIPHRSQPSLVGHFESPPQESVGDGSGRLPQIQENYNMAAGPDGGRNDPRGRYTGYNQNWPPRSGFYSREVKEEPHPFSGSSAYHMTGNGQYGNGYMGGYPLGFSPTPPAQHYSFAPPSAPK